MRKAMSKSESECWTKEEQEGHPEKLLEKRNNEEAYTLWYSELDAKHIALFRLLSEIQKEHAKITHVTSSHITIEAQKYVIDKIREEMKSGENVRKCSTCGHDMTYFSRQKVWCCSLCDKVDVEKSDE